MLLAATALPATAACNVSAIDLNFGPYDPLGPSDSTSAGSITVTCDQSPAPTVSILVGPSSNGGGFAPRRLRQAGGTDTLAYNIYTDPANTRIWGDGTGGTAMLTHRVQKNAPWSPTIYGRVRARQDVAVGNYSDAIAITIQF